MLRSWNAIVGEHELRAQEDVSSAVSHMTAAGSGSGDSKSESSKYI